MRLPLLITVVVSLVFSVGDHLVLNRITITPNAGEMVSIFNPSSEIQSLDNYYITDATDSPDNQFYYNIPTGTNFWSTDFRDFIAKFPSGISISPGDSLILGIRNSEVFTGYYGYSPDLTLFENMYDAIDGESTITEVPLSIGILDDSREALILFYWDGISSTVKDVDYFLWGGTDEGVSKGPDQGYFQDTLLELQSYIQKHEEYFTYVRADNYSENNIFYGYEKDSGNGITGDDETSEKINSTWDIISSPEVGCTNQFAYNYDSDAFIDSGDCWTCSINENSQAIPISQILDGTYSIGNNVIVEGVIVDYFDVTPYQGPHSITIESMNNPSMNAQRLEISIFPDDWDVSNSIQSFLVTPPFDRYLVRIYGEIDEYDGQLQIALDNPGNFCIKEILGCTDPSASNYSTDITDDFQEYCRYNNETIKKAEIITEPYVIIPTRNEKLNFEYSFPGGSRVIVRIFDISGRFITSLEDQYYDDSARIERNVSSYSAWDGKDHLGQIVAPGTYIIHLEAMNFSTGETYTDAAPIVVGVEH